MSQIYFVFVSISKNKFWRFYCDFQSLICSDKHLLKMDDVLFYHETVVLSIQNIYKKLWVRKNLQFYAEIFCLFKPVAVNSMHIKL